MEETDNPDEYKQVVSFTRDLEDLVKVRLELLETIAHLCADPPTQDLDDALIALREVAQVLARTEEDLRSNLVNLKLMYALVVKKTELLGKELDEMEKAQLEPAAELFDVEGLDDLGDIEHFFGAPLVKEMVADVKQHRQIDQVVADINTMRGREFATTFHDGKVRVRMNASCKLLSFEIDPDLVTDPEALGDVVVETVNGTMDTVREEADRILSRLPLPPSPFVP